MTGLSSHILLPFTTNPSETDATAIIPQNLASANNDFAVNFYKQISDKDDNIFFSPTSMLVAFSLVYEGARDDTADQIQDVFGLESDPLIRHDSMTHLLSSLNRDDSYATFVMENKYIDYDVTKAFDKYLNVAREIYFANIIITLIVSDGAIDNMESVINNDKIKKVITKNDGIDDLISLASTTIFHRDLSTIINDIYFQGTWITPFSVENTAESDFWPSATESITVDFMNVNGSFDYMQSNDVQVLEMPYVEDRLSMLVILPKDRDGIYSLEEYISSEIIEKWQQNLRPTKVIVSMPKFEVVNKYYVGETLMGLGMIDVFNNELADLKNTGPSLDYANLYAVSVIHKALVNVNEVGAGTAAVTDMTVQDIGEHPTTLKFTANHPFLFIIQDNESDTILFMGKLSDPSCHYTYTNNGYKAKCLHNSL